MHILPATTHSLSYAVAVLRAGGVVAHPTETCYGLACDLKNPAALKKLFDIKARPYEQPVSALFSSVDTAKAYVELSSRALELAERHLPGPLTIVAPIKKDAPVIFVTVSDLPATRQPPPASVGVRISSHPFAQALAESFGSPIATTSANLHGKPNPYSSSDIAEQLKDHSPVPDLILDGGTLPEAPPSTVVSVSGPDLRVLRQGDLKIL